MRSQGALPSSILLPGKRRCPGPAAARTALSTDCSSSHLTLGGGSLPFSFALELNITKLLRPRPSRATSFSVTARNLPFLGRPMLTVHSSGHLSPWVHLILAAQRREVTVLKAHSHLELGQIRTQTPLLPSPLRKWPFLLTNQDIPHVCHHLSLRTGVWSFSGYLAPLRQWESSLWAPLDKTHGQQVSCSVTIRAIHLVLVTSPGGAPPAPSCSHS